MRIAILTDTHFGIKNSADVCFDYQKRFLDEVFFPFCDKHKVTRVLHLGDFFDVRKHTTTKALYFIRHNVIAPMRKRGIRIDIIPGNHDVVYKNTNEFCSITELFIENNDVINLHLKPTEIEIDSLKIGMIPWINDENTAETLDFIDKTTATFICAHLELAGFEMMRGGGAMSHGMDPKLFSKFEHVLSGHYHTKSSRDNITYLGVPYEQTWADSNDPKFFHSIDTSTRQLKAHRNKQILFHRLVYDDSCGLDKISDETKTAIANSFVRVVVVCKNDPFTYDRFIDDITASNPFEYKVVENLIKSCIPEDSRLDVSDTTTLLCSYIDAIDTPLDKTILKSYLNTLYTEAQQSDAQ